MKVISDDTDDDLDPRTIDGMLIEIEKECRIKFCDNTIKSIVEQVKSFECENFECCKKLISRKIQKAGLV